MSTEALQEQNTPEVDPVAEQEVIEQPQEETQEEVQEEAAAPESDAAFEAGFSGVEETPEPEPEPAKLIAGMTEDQLKELLAKAAEVDKLREQQNKAFGALGSLKQSIEQLRNQPRPKATAVQVTKEKFAKLSQMFPEMAEALAEDLNGVLTGSAPADVTHIEQAVEQRLQERLEVQKMEFETKLLSTTHPDWQEVRSSPDFEKWMGLLKPEYAHQLQTTWDSRFVSDAMTEFKNWKSKAVQGQAQKKSRLEAAITPKGGPVAPAKTLDDAFLEGFKSA
jgi:hypothetical protein